MSNPVWLAALVLASTALGLHGSAQGLRVSSPLAREVVGDVGDQFVSPDGTRVVYKATQLHPVNEDLFSVSSAGGPSMRLTPPVAISYSLHDFKVVITSDSATVLYVRDGLFRVPIAGGPAVRLSPEGDDRFIRTLRLSPDGTRAVYDVQGGEYRLYSVALEGGPPAALSSTSPSSFTISSDSSRVVYSRFNGFLVSVPIEGGPVTRLDATTRGVAAWSLAPDGSRVAYIADQDTLGVYEIFSVPTTGGAPLKLNPPLVSGGDVEVSIGVRPDDISPDSTRVVYVADQDTDGVKELYSVPIAGGAVVKLNAPLVSGGNVDDYHLSPDATRVVYLADQEVDGTLELFSVPIAGGASVRLNAPLLAPQRVNGGFVRISPDSNHVVYVEQEGDTLRLSVVPIAGGARILLSETDLTLRVPMGFSADSSRLVYRESAWNELEGYDSYRLRSVPVMGGAPLQLDAPLLENLFLDNRLVSFLLVPGSDQVVYRAAQDLEGVTELFGVPVAGGPTTKLNSPLHLGSSVVGDVTSFDLSQDGSRAIYRADQDYDETFELYGVRVVEGAPTRLSGAMVRGGDVTSFALARDGQGAIYIADQDVDETFELYGRLLDGPAPVRISGALVPGGDVTHAELSPSDTWVVYRADKETDETFELYATTGGPSLKLNEPLLAGQSVTPFWTYGTAFAFSLEDHVVYPLEDATRDVTELCSSPLAGGPSVVLSVPLASGQHVVDFRVSPDGASVVYLVDEEELYSVPVQGGASVRLNEPLASAGFVSSSFEIAPDGLRVAYRAIQDTPGSIELYSAPIQGGSIVKLNGPLFPSGGVDSFAFSPDGSHVIYSAEQESAAQSLYGVPAGGGPAVRLSAPDESIQYGRYQISADSARVVYTTFLPTVGVLESVPIGGGSRTLLASTGQSVGFSIGPDSRSVLYSSIPFQSGALSRVPIAGGSPRVIGGELTSPPRLSFPPRYGGGKVLYLANQGEDSTDQLYLAFLTRPHRSTR